MTGPDQIALGKLPKQSDSRTILLPRLLTGRIDLKPEAHNETVVARPWGELGNDKISDCTCAAVGHAEMLWAALYGGHLADPTLDQVADAYSKVTGYVPGDRTTDKGADILSVLKYWQKTGIAGQKIGAYAEIPTQDVNTLRWAIESLGLAYVGLQLPSVWITPKQAIERQRFATSRRWYDPATWQNPINGHCVIYTGYDTRRQQFTCVSWGKVMTISLAFHQAYCDEAYAIIPPERVDGNVATPNLDAALLKDTRDFAKSVTRVMTAGVGSRLDGCPTG